MTEATAYPVVVLHHYLGGDAIAYPLKWGEYQVITSGELRIIFNHPEFSFWLRETAKHIALPLRYLALPATQQHFAHHAVKP